MSYFLSLLTMLLTGLVVLMAGILLVRDQGQSFQSVFANSMAWGTAYFISFGTEFLILAHI